MTAQKRLVPAGGNVFPIEVLGDAPPAFGIDPNRLLVVTFPLDIARTETRYFTGASTFIWARSATSIGANIDIRFQNQRGSRVNFQQGMLIRGLRFDTLFLTNIAQAAETITFLLVREGPGNIETINPLSSASNVTIIKPATITSTIDLSIAFGAAAEVLAANSARREAILSNLAANASPFRVGDSNVTATRGIELNPGQTIILEGTAAIHAHNTDGASAQSIGRVAVID